jgi:transcriptional/translational regulatory protein YebC/TACO1
VSWQFSRRGVVLVTGGAPEDALLEAALDAGADDLEDDGGTWRVTCEPSATMTVSERLSAAGFDVLSAETPMVSDNLVPVDSVEAARAVLRILDVIEDNDDVQDVYANFDIPDEIIEAATS